MDSCGDVGEGTKTITNSPATVTWDPYMLWTGDICSTVGTARDTEAKVAEIEARARQELESQTSHLIEAILWTNLVDGADFGGSHPNVSLSDGSVANGNTAPTQAQKDAGYIYTPNGWNTYPLVTAWRFLTEAIGEVLGGARAMIHVEKRIVGDIVYAGLAVQNGQRLLTTDGDHVVVPGTGYTGSDPEEVAPGDFHSWIYATSMVEVLTTPIEVFRGPASDVIDRSDNQIEVRAERMALAHWDRQCHIGVPVCLEDPFGDCSDANS